jgi:hypothetical protein
VRSSRARNLLACTFSILILAGRVAADDRNEGALWLVNQVGVPIDDRFAFHTMLQNRWVNDLDSYERTVVRPWISFDWTEHVELAIGYDRHEFKNTSDENRAWQRIAYQYDFGKPTLFTHFWLEERFFEGAERIAWRGRFQIGGSLELPYDLGLLVRNEFLVDLNETSRVRRSGLGEDQFYAGLYYPLASGLRFDVGYLMQYRDMKGPDLFDHTLFMGFSVTTPRLGDLF